MLGWVDEGRFYRGGVCNWDLKEERVLIGRVGSYFRWYKQFVGFWYFISFYELCLGNYKV